MYDFNHDGIQSGFDAYTRNKLTESHTGHSSGHGSGNNPITPGRAITAAIVLILWLLLFFL